MARKSLSSSATCYRARDVHQSCPTMATVTARVRRSRAGVVLLAAVSLNLLAFMSLSPTVDPLTRGLTPGRVYELGLLAAGTAILFVYAARRGYPMIVPGPEVGTLVA